MLTRCLLIGSAGFCGAVARYLISLGAYKLVPSRFPFGTLAVNGLACLIVGALWALSEHRWSPSPETRALVFVGFLGAFSTFSTYILETSEMMRDANWAWAIGNILLQNAVGFALALAGYGLGRLA